MQGDGGRAQGMRSGLLWLYGAEALGKILALYAFGHLGRVLLEAGMGDLEFSLHALFVAALLLDAGLAPYGVTEASHHPKGVSTLAGRIVALRFMLACVAIPALVLIGWARGGAPDATRLTALYALVLLPGVFALNWAFEAKRAMHVVAMTNLSRQIVFAVGVTLLVHGREDILRLPFIDGTGLAVAVFVQGWFFRRGVGAFPVLGIWHGVGKVFSESLPLSVSSLVWALRIFLPGLALGFLAPASTMGRYGVAHRLFMAAHAFVWLYFVNLLPTLARQAKSAPDLNARVMRASLGLVGWVTFLGGGATWILARPLVVAIYGDAFADAATPLRLLTLALVITFLSGHARYGLIAHRRRAEELIAALAGLTMVALGIFAIAEEATAETAALSLVAGEMATWFVAWRLHHLRVLRVGALRPLAGPLLAWGFGLACLGLDWQGRSHRIFDALLWWGTAGLAGFFLARFAARRRFV